MSALDRRSGKTDHGLWRQLRVPLLVGVLVTLGLVLKLEITEAAFRGAEVRG